MQKQHEHQQQTMDHQIKKYLSHLFYKANEQWQLFAFVRLQEKERRREGKGRGKVKRGKFQKKIKSLARIQKDMHTVKRKKKRKKRKKRRREERKERKELSPLKFKPRSPISV